MAQATQDAPLTLDPTQATKLRIKSFTAECDSRAVSIVVHYLDAGDQIVAEKTIQVDGAQVNTWMTAQETTIYTRLLAKLGVTGTIG